MAIDDASRLAYTEVLTSLGREDATGFIERTAREELLLHLNDEAERSRTLLRFIYFFFGGIVAGVFQVAQPETLAPIQAFVLGITWPSVVSRSMTSPSSGQSPGDLLRRGPGAGGGSGGGTGGPPGAGGGTGAGGGGGGGGAAPAAVNAAAGTNPQATTTAVPAPATTAVPS